MSKRGRNSTWWGWDYFSATSERNSANNELYLCQVPVGKDKDDKPVLCCESLAYAGSNTNFKTHLKGRHRVWYADKSSEKAPKTPSKQPKLTDYVKPEAKSDNEGPRAATQTERDELDQDLLGYVVDDLRGVSSVEGIIYYYYYLSLAAHPAS